MKAHNRKLRERFYREEDEFAATPLLMLLNEDPGFLTPPVCRRIRRLFSDLQRLEAMRVSLKSLEPQFRSMLIGVSSHHKQATPLVRECEELLDSINARLWHYRWAPKVEVVRGSISRTETWRETGDGEYFVVWLLLKELSEGRIDRLRRCIHCGRWFYSRTDHQKYCSGRCRTGEHSQGAEFRKKRARYMREQYRPALRERDASAKRNVRKGRGR